MKEKTHYTKGKLREYLIVREAKIRYTVAWDEGEKGHLCMAEEENAAECMSRGREGTVQLLHVKKIGRYTAV
jgi:hypothetical protein